MAMIHDKTGAPMDLFDTVQYSPDPKTTLLADEQRFVFAMITSITDGMQSATVRLSYVSRVGVSGRVATIGKVDPKACLLVAKADGVLVAAPDAKVLPVKGELATGKSGGK